MNAHDTSSDRMRVAHTSFGHFNRFDSESAVQNKVPSIDRWALAINRSMVSVISIDAAICHGTSKRREGQRNESSIMQRFANSNERFPRNVIGGGCDRV